MRFGKKLAIQVMEDSSGAPYLSHKPMKEAINRTVRELRLYQARENSNDPAAQSDGACTGAGASSDNSQSQQLHLQQHAERIVALDAELFSLVDEDLVRIQRHARSSELHLQELLARLQQSLVEASFLCTEQQVQRLEKLMGQTDRAALCSGVLELRIRSDPPGVADDLQSIAAEYNTMVEAASQHAQYLEINVAGFRKLLKRHEKQIPSRFRSRPMPCLAFHRLVTRTSRTLLDLAKQSKAILDDVRLRWQTIIGSSAGIDWVTLVEVKGLGPECEMVINIQQQLKDPANRHLMTGGSPRGLPDAAGGGCLTGVGGSGAYLESFPESDAGSGAGGGSSGAANFSGFVGLHGCLYPKPEVPLRTGAVQKVNSGSNKGGNAGHPAMNANCGYPQAQVPWTMNSMTLVKAG
mmetsp:Transcript_95898/g.209790  ORF Transcript_95898/g.209790 Transcript_95898/m.209790 type:complete len:409 (+) Transcript_95898:59-1285(+)